MVRKPTEAGGGKQQEGVPHRAGPQPEVLGPPQFGFTTLSDLISHNLDEISILPAVPKYTMSITPSMPCSAFLFSLESPLGLLLD